ncbi:MAG: hypothetical protein FWE07_03720 [Turicibacter sp.]|nr:hypothetical protein [Turicibacter sp.]
MLKKTLTTLVALTATLLLVACGTNGDYEEDVIDLGAFLEENRERLIDQIAPDGEEVDIALSEDANKFVFTIVLDTIELTDENRTAYSMAFTSSFVHMEPLFVGLAEEIREAVERDYFALRVIFVDVNREEIASQIFSTLLPSPLEALEAVTVPEETEIGTEAEAPTDDDDE